MFFLVGAFSLKKKSPTITVGSFFFFFSLQSHSEWPTFYNLFIRSVVHLHLSEAGERGFDSRT